MKNRLLTERAVREEGPARPAARGKTRPVRSVTVNLAESPLGWLKARGLISARQFDAGEQLRGDWERANLPPVVTMRWDAAPMGRGARGPSDPAAATEVQLVARRRFETAVAAAGSGLADILWRIVCAGEGMREAEQALGWPARAGRLVLSLALDRLADHYRIG
ncbi:DUF6456 domain-containing protein [Sphingosinicella sp.]|uniref:DUF6456 domain-containing protein n=1 Tax=Sphingosinicella sp. TaxID=1917971 RepID=UPI00403810A7